MKRLALTLAIVLGMTVGVMAQQYGGGLFERGYADEEYYNTSADNEGGYFSDLRGLLNLNLPEHGGQDNQGATPVGSGIAVLLGLGGAYLVAKKRREE